MFCIKCFSIMIESKTKKLIVYRKTQHVTDAISTHTHGNSQKLTKHIFSFASNCFGRFRTAVQFINILYRTEWKETTKKQAA